mmetsp:Transcript_13994/g.44828  ORF Transcript_13994/g.44828 Transcript_13994/m.44828 type:complete len:87 (+) Transcript_13994:248-508(+)
MQKTVEAAAGSMSGATFESPHRGAREHDQGSGDALMAREVMDLLVAAPDHENLNDMDGLEEARPRAWARRACDGRGPGARTRPERS